MKSKIPNFVAGPTFSPISNNNNNIAGASSNRPTAAANPSGAKGARVNPPETNILFVHLDSPDAARLADRLRERGVLASVMGEPALRFVTHRDVTMEDCESAGTALAENSHTL